MEISNTTSSISKSLNKNLISNGFDRKAYFLKKAIKEKNENIVEEILGKKPKDLDGLTLKEDSLLFQIFFNNKIRKDYDLDLFDFLIEKNNMEWLGYFFNLAYNNVPMNKKLIINSWVDSFLQQAFKEDNLNLVKTVQTVLEKNNKSIQDYCPYNSILIYHIMSTFNKIDLENLNKVDYGIYDKIKDYPLKIFNFCISYEDFKEKEKRLLVDFFKNNNMSFSSFEGIARKEKDRFYKKSSNKQTKNSDIRKVLENEMSKKDKAQRHFPYEYDTNNWIKKDYEKNIYSEIFKESFEKKQKKENLLSDFTLTLLLAVLGNHSKIIYWEEEQQKHLENTLFLYQSYGDIDSNLNCLDNSQVSNLIENSIFSFISKIIDIKNVSDLCINKEKNMSQEATNWFNNILIAYDFYFKSTDYCLSKPINLILNANVLDKYYNKMFSEETSKISLLETEELLDDFVSQLRKSMKYGSGVSYPNSQIRNNNYRKRKVSFDFRKEGVISNFFEKDNLSYKHKMIPLSVIFYIMGYDSLSKTIKNSSKYLEDKHMKFIQENPFILLHGRAGYSVMHYMEKYSDNYKDINPVAHFFNYNKIFDLHFFSKVKNKDIDILLKSIIKNCPQYMSDPFQTPYGKKTVDEMLIEIDPTGKYKSELETEAFEEKLEVKKRKKQASAVL